LTRPKKHNRPGMAESRDSRIVGASSVRMERRPDLRFGFHQSARLVQGAHCGVDPQPLDSDSFGPPALPLAYLEYLSTEAAQQGLKSRPCLHDGPDAKTRRHQGAHIPGEPIGRSSVSRRLQPTPTVAVRGLMGPVKMTSAATRAWSLPQAKAPS